MQSAMLLSRRSATFAVARILPAWLRHSVARLPEFERIHGWLVESNGLAAKRVVGGSLQGALFEFDVNHEKAYSYGTYETETQQVLEGLELAGGVAWDVGAHAGFFSLLLSRLCDRVVAIEPDPGNARRLRRNVRLNSAQVEVVEAAVGRSPGVARLAIGEDSRMSHVDPSGAVEVPQLTLDQLAERHGLPRLIKIDVEGAELDVLLGAENVLAPRPTIVLEAHSPMLVENVTSLLNRSGYDVRPAGPTPERFTPRLLVASAR